MLQRKNLVKTVRSQCKRRRSDTPEFRRGYSDITSRFRNITTDKQAQLKRAQTATIPKKNYRIMRLVLIQPIKDNHILTKTILFEKKFLVKVKKVVKNLKPFNIPRQRIKKNKIIPSKHNLRSVYLFDKMSKAKKTPFTEKSNQRNPSPIKIPPNCVRVESVEKEKPFHQGKIVTRRVDVSPIKNVKNNTRARFGFNRKRINQPQFSEIKKRMKESLVTSNHRKLPRKATIDLSGILDERSGLPNTKKVKTGRQRLVHQGFSNRNRPNFARDVKPNFYKTQVSNQVNHNMPKIHVQKYTRKGYSCERNQTSNSRNNYHQSQSKRSDNKPVYFRIVPSNN